MKNYLIILLISVCCNIVTAQVTKGNDVFTRDTISAKFNQKRLFSTTNAFLAKDFLSKHDVLKFSDKDEGIIICNGDWYYRDGKKAVFYDLEFKISDGQIIFQLDEFYLWNQSMGYSQGTSLNELLDNSWNMNDDPRFHTKKVSDAKKQIEDIRLFLIEGITERINDLK